MLTRITARTFIIIAAIAIIVAAVHDAANRPTSSAINDPSSQGSLPSDRRESTYSTEINRQALSGNGADITIYGSSYIEELVNCLQSRDPHGCLTSTLTSRLEPEELAQLWHAIGDDVQLSKLALKYSLEYVNPGLAPDFFHDLFNELSKLQRSVTLFQMVAESTIRDMVAAQSPWAASFAHELDQQALFDESGADALVLVARYCIPLDEDILGHLMGGARGEWFGTTAQQERALSVVFEVLGKEPQRLSAFASELLSSPTLPSSASYGAHLAAMLTFERNSRAISGQESARMIHWILSDPRYESAAARQLLSMYNANPPRGFSEEEWNGIWLRVESIMGPH